MKLLLEQICLFGTVQIHEFMKFLKQRDDQKTRNMLILKKCLRSLTLICDTVLVTSEFTKQGQHFFPWN
jgi:hypothetical protein